MLKKYFGAIKRYMELQRIQDENKSLAQAYRQGKLKQKYLDRLAGLYSRAKNKETEIKKVAESKLAYYCFRELQKYAERRQEVNQDKALAYLTWRAAQLRKTFKQLKKYSHQKSAMKR